MKPMAPPALSVGKVAQFVHGQWRGHRDRRCSLARAASPAAIERSEEHTSELQSLMRISNAVFCLNKKNNTCSDKNTTLNSQRPTLISKWMSYKINNDKPIQ